MCEGRSRAAEENGSSSYLGGTTADDIGCPSNVGKISDTSQIEFKSRTTRHGSCVSVGAGAC